MAASLRMIHDCLRTQPLSLFILLEIDALLFYSREAGNVPNFGVPEERIQGKALNVRVWNQGTDVRGGISIRLMNCLLAKFSAERPPRSQGTGTSAF